MNKSDLLWVASIVVLPLAVYSLADLAIARADDRPVASVDCFDPSRVSEMSTGRLVGSVAMAIGGSAFLFGTPTLLAMCAVMRVPGRWATAHVWSLGINCAALVALCNILRLAGNVSRVSFVSGWLIWCIVLAICACRVGKPHADLSGLWKRYGHAVLVAVVTVTIGIVVFRKEHLVQCLDGDGGEFYWLANTLRDHFLPYFAMEQSEGFGTYVVNPAVLNSYWTWGLQLMLGEAELATRLSYWVYWLGIILVWYRMLEPTGPKGVWVVAPALALSVLLQVAWASFYCGYYFYMADVAASGGVPDALLTLFFLLSFDCLLRGEATESLLCLVLGSLVLYAGPVMMVLLAAAALTWKPVERRRILGALRIAATALISVAMLYVIRGVWEGTLSDWWIALRLEYIEDYFDGESRWLTGLRYAGFYAIGSGGIAVLGLFRGMRGTAWERTITTTTLAYLMIVLGAANKNLHYLMPLLLVPLLLWLRTGHHSRPTLSWLRPTLAAVSLTICLFVCWPVSRPVFVLNRQLGAHTTFQANSYEEACSLATVIFKLYDLGVVPWVVHPQNWIAHAKIEDQPTETRTLFVTRGAAPSPEYRQLEHTGGVKVYVTDEKYLNWLATRQPMLDSVRFPRVFSSLVKTPRKPKPIPDK